MTDTTITTEKEDKPQLKLRIRYKIDQSWTIADIATKQPPAGWLNVFKAAEHELAEISEDLENDALTNGRFYPDKKDLFNAFDLTPLNKVRVVIVGQDPYHNMSCGRPTAVGVSFGSFRGADIPKSLQTIYKELVKSIPGFKMPNHPDLTKWCQQGVLMYNTCLTVLPGRAFSHKKVWGSFMYHVISSILAVNPTCIFVLWGRKAQSAIKGLLGNKGKVLEAGHPSPLSMKDFIGCDHFNKINALLIERGDTPIDWQV
jgi:uracil-DNA glycosylase